jgi:hypothetical protein
MATLNATIETICVAPLSSPYSLLPRAHTYSLVLLLFAPLPRGWLFRAALAAFTTRTAIFAVDAVVLLASLRNAHSSRAHHGAPLDALVATEMLSLASIVAIWLLLRSERAGESAARGLIRIWALVVGVGAIVGFVALKGLGVYHAAAEEEGKELGECDGLLMSREDIIGVDQVFGSGLGVLGDKIGWFVLRIGIVGVLFAATALLSTLRPRPPNKHQQVAATYVDGPPHEAYTQENPFSIYPTLWRIVGHVLLVALPALAIFVAASAEYFYFRIVPALPSVEMMSSVGQWGVWVATGAVLIATAANATMERMGMKPRPGDHEPWNGNEVVKV